MGRFNTPSVFNFGFMGAHEFGFEKNQSENYLLSSHDQISTSFDIIST
jgi:hypothetical protein